jgi:hypothetical protein
MNPAAGGFRSAIEAEANDPKDDRQILLLQKKIRCAVAANSRRSGWIHAALQRGRLISPAARARRW